MQCEKCNSVEVEWLGRFCQLCWEQFCDDTWWDQFKDIDLRLGLNSKESEQI